jgi:glycosyltransferase involved in cell wall biosynthesis
MSIRRTIGIEDKIVLGFFGHLKKKKGVDVFIESLAVSSVADYFHVLIVGDLDQDLADMIARHGSRVRVTNLSLVDQYRTVPYYLVCDFVVLPSFYDGLPNVALEAAALGCVLIATESAGGLAFPGSALLLENRSDPLTGNIATLRRALSMTEEERFDRGQLAAKIVREEYTPEKERDAYLSILAATCRTISVVSEGL